jgi:heme-degrading monooxygenase HmoA
MNMYVVFVRHQVQPGRFLEAAKRVASNGTRMEKSNGFVSRSLLQGTANDLELATITVWADRKSYDDWTEVNRKANVHAGTPSPFLGTAETLAYDQLPLDTLGA